MRRNVVRRRSAARRLALSAALLPLAAGCTSLWTQLPPAFNTFLLLDGGGPREYSETDLSLVEDFRGAKEVLEAGAVRGLAPGETTRVGAPDDEEAAWPGPVRQVTAARGPSGEVTLCQREWWDLELRWTKYSAEGRPLARGASGVSEPVPVLVAPLLGWGLLLNHYASVKPAGDASHALAPPGLARFGGDPSRPEANRYEVKEGWSLLAGILGWGEVNGRRYGQILWIPVPLGSSDAG